MGLHDTEEFVAAVNAGDDLGAYEEEEGEFTEGEKETVLAGFGKPKVTDVPFEKKEIKADKPKDDEAERFKQILLDLGFHKKQNGDDKEQYVKKEGDIVIGRTFTEQFPTGKFWALKNNNFLDAPEVKELGIVQEFYDIRDGKKQQTLDTVTPYTKDGLVKAPHREMTTVVPSEVIANSELMATALYNVVEQQHLYMDIGGKKYLQLEAWQLLGKFCEVRGVVESVHPVEYFGIKGFEARAVVIDSEDKKIAEAESVCMMDELTWKTKPLYQLKSMAQTRALSKAYRSCLSFIVSIAGYSPTPLEEMQGVD